MEDIVSFKGKIPQYNGSGIPSPKLKDFLSLTLEPNLFECGESFSLKLQVQFYLR